jgi:hypothetical protein
VRLRLRTAGVQPLPFEVHRPLLRPLQSRQRI